MTPIGRVLDQARRAARPRRHPRRRPAASGAPTPTRPGPGSSARATCPTPSAATGSINANDSYWLPNPDERLEGFAHIIGCEQCERTMRTRMVYRYVQDRLAGPMGSHRPAGVAGDLRGHEHENRVMAAEVMRANGDLDTLCDATGRDPRRARPARLGRPLGRAAPWAPTSSRSSWPGCPTRACGGRRSTPAEPLNTPRDLNDPQPAGPPGDGRRHRRPCASEASPSTPTWGSLQVAGDRGAPPIPLGGGTGDAVGNANALASRWPEDNTDRYRADHLRLLAHPGDLVPGRRRGRRPHDPDLRPVRGPDLAVVGGPDADLRQGQLGALPLDRRGDRAADLFEDTPFRHPEARPHGWGSTHFTHPVTPSPHDPIHHPADRPGAWRERCTHERISAEQGTKDQDDPRRWVKAAVAASVAALAPTALSTAPAEGTVVDIAPGHNITVFHNIDFVATFGHAAETSDC